MTDTRIVRLQDDTIVDANGLTAMDRDLVNGNRFPYFASTRVKMFWARAHYEPPRPIKTKTVAPSVGCELTTLRRHVLFLEHQMGVLRARATKVIAVETIERQFRSLQQKVAALSTSGTDVQRIREAVGTLGDHVDMVRKNIDKLQQQSSATQSKMAALERKQQAVMVRK